MKIYLSRPMTGCQYEEVIAYYTTLDKMIKKIGHETLVPMVKYEYLAMGAKNKQRITSTLEATVEHSVFLRDRWMTENCDIVLCDLSEAKIVSIGCMMELAWANAWRKHTVTVMPLPNVHSHIFVNKASDILFDTLQEAINYIKKL